LKIVKYAAYVKFNPVPKHHHHVSVLLLMYEGGWERQISISISSEELVQIGFCGDGYQHRIG
jgi:hypothetical protein